MRLAASGQMQALQSRTTQNQANGVLVSCEREMVLSEAQAMPIAVAEFEVFEFVALERIEKLAMHLQSSLRRLLKIEG